MAASASDWVTMPGGPATEVRHSNGTGSERQVASVRAMASVADSRLFGFSTYRRCCASMAALHVDPHAGILDPRLPAAQFLLDVGIELGRRAGDGVDAHAGELLAHLRHRQDDVDLAVEALHDLGRR